MYSLQGKTLFITGAAGGIGAAVARQAYAKGANLILTDITQDSVDVLANEFEAGRVLPLALDVTDFEATQSVIAQGSEKFGHVDICFANAGISWRGDPATIFSCDPAEFRKIVDVDLFGVFYSVKACLPEIVKNGGYVLATSSVYAFTNGMANAPYATSKAGVEQMTRALRAELAGTSATAGVLYPGWVSTPIAKLAFGGHALATKMINAAFPAFMRKPITPEQLAEKAVAGMEKRSFSVIAPAFWNIFSWYRGPYALLTDVVLRGNKKLHALTKELDELNFSKKD